MCQQLHDTRKSTNTNFGSKYCVNFNQYTPKSIGFLVAEVYGH